MARGAFTVFDLFRRTESCVRHRRSNAKCESHLSENSRGSAQMRYGAAFFPARTCCITASENTAMLMALESVGSLGDGYVLGRCRNWLSKHDLRDELNVETLG